MLVRGLVWLHGHSSCHPGVHAVISIWLGIRSISLRFSAAQDVIKMYRSANVIQDCAAAQLQAGSHTHPDDSPRGVQQRAARVARVDGGIGLYASRDDAAHLAPDLSVDAADHAGGQSVVKAKGVAYGQALLPHAQPLRAAQHCRLQHLLRGPHQLEHH